MRKLLILLMFPLAGSAEVLFFSGAETGGIQSSGVDSFDTHSCLKDGKAYAIRSVGQGYVEPNSPAHESAPPPRAGNRMWRFEERKGDTCKSNQGNYRNELVKGGVMKWGEGTYYYGFSIYVPGTGWYKGNQGPGGGGYIHQPKTYDGPCYWNIQGRDDTGTYQWWAAGSKKWVPLAYDRWQDWVFKVNPSYSGSVETWVDGVSIGGKSGDMSAGCDKQGKLPTGHDMNLRWGEYLSVSEGRSYLLMYVDEIRIGRSRDEVLPGAGTASPPGLRAPSIPSGLTIVP